MNTLMVSLFTNITFTFAQKSTESLHPSDTKAEVWYDVHAGTYSEIKDAFTVYEILGDIGLNSQRVVQKDDKSSGTLYLVLAYSTYAKAEAERVCYEINRLHPEWGASVIEKSDGNSVEQKK